MVLYGAWHQFDESLASIFMSEDLNTDEQKTSRDEDRELVLRGCETARRAGKGIFSSHSPDQIWPDNFGSRCHSMQNVLTLARTGGLVQPPLRFFADSEKTAALRRRVLGYLMGQTLRSFFVKKMTRSGQVTELWRHKKNNLRQFYLQIRVLPHLDVTPLMQMIIFEHG